MVLSVSLAVTYVFALKPHFTIIDPEGVGEKKKSKYLRTCRWRWAGGENACVIPTARTRERSRGVGKALFKAHRIALGAREPVALYGGSR